MSMKTKTVLLESGSSPKELVCFCSLAGDGNPVFVSSFFAGKALVKTLTKSEAQTRLENLLADGFSVVFERVS